MNLNKLTFKTDFGGHGHSCPWRLSTRGNGHSSFLSDWMPTWWSFLIFWMVMHTFNHLAYIAASVYVVEVVGPSKRHYGQIMSIGFGIGYVLSSPIAFGFPHWKNFTTAFAITSIPVIIILAFLPQSPRWVYADGRPHDGLEILKSFERWTKATLPDNLDNEIRETGDTVNTKTLTIADVFKSFHLRKIALLMGFAFIAVTIAYYGLAYNAAALPGDLYVNNAINGAVETLAYILLMFSMPYIGRKWLTSSTFLSGDPYISYRAVDPYISDFAIILRFSEKNQFQIFKKKI